MGDIVSALAIGEEAIERPGDERPGGEDKNPVSMVVGSEVPHAVLPREATCRHSRGGTVVGFEEMGEATIDECMWISFAMGFVTARWPRSRTAMSSVPR